MWESSSDVTFWDSQQGLGSALDGDLSAAVCLWTGWPLGGSHAPCLGVKTGADDLLPPGPVAGRPQL